MLRFHIWTLILLILGLTSCENPADRIDRMEYERQFDEGRIISLMESEDIATQIGVVRMLGRQQNSDSRQLLTSVLDTVKHPDLLTETIFALGQLPPDQETEMKLTAIGHAATVPFIRLAVSDALGKMGSRFSESYLAAELESEDAKRRSKAAVAAGLIGRRERIILDALLKILETNVLRGEADAWLSSRLRMNWRLAFISLIICFTVLAKLTILISSLALKTVKASSKKSTTDLK